MPIRRPEINRLMICNLAEHKRMPTHQHALMDAAVAMWLNTLIDLIESDDGSDDTERSPD